MSESTLATMLIVAILVLGVVMETISLPQQGVASRGCTPGSIADEASNGLCLQRGDRGLHPVRSQMKQVMDCAYVTHHLALPLEALEQGVAYVTQRCHLVRFL